jgi:hypothetical protein
MNKYFITPIIILLFNIALIAQPASDAVFEKIEKTYTLNDDGSMDFRYYKKLKLLTPYSFNRLYGETFIVYNPPHQQLTINLARVTQKDGKEVNAPENAFNEVLPHFAADAPFYNHLREMVVTHAGLESEVVIELDYTIHSDSGYFSALMADELISESSPVLEENIIIRLPDWKKLYYKVLNLRTAPVITASKGYNEYKFTFVNINENTHESNQPLDNSHLPHLLFSTFSAAAAQHYLACQDALSYNADESMKNAVAKLKKESKNDLQLVLKIRDMVVNNINTYPIPLEFTGYTARTPVKIWNSNGGTPFEKCLLMTTLYRIAKINAEPLVIIPSAIYNDTIGILSQATEFLVQVNPRELEQIILSPVSSTDQNKTYSLIGNTSLLLNKDKPYITHYKDQFENKVTMDGKFNLNDSMLMTGSTTLLLSEIANPYYELNMDSASAKQLSGGGLSAKDIKTIKVEKASQIRSEVKIEIEKKQAAKVQANYFFINLPFCKKGMDSWHINYLTAERLTPFAVPNNLDEEYEFTYSIPDGFRLINPLTLTELKANFGELSLSIIQDGNSITVNRKLKIYRQTIAITDYKAFKQMIDLWNEGKYRELVLKK